MGTACAPRYTKSFLARFGKKHIYSFIKDKVELYLRYAEGIFFYLEEYGKKTKKII